MTPRPDRAWSREVKAWWRDFWDSEQAGQLRPSDHPAVWRLFGWYHRRELLQSKVDGTDLLVSGSTGQPKVTPLLAEIRAIDDQIEALERRVFGQPPAAAGQGGYDPAALLDAVNARFDELVRARAEDPDDLRLQLVPGGLA